MEIKDSLIDFFHSQGITIVTIQPEFKIKSTDETKDTNSLTQCLIGCQSLECAPKTCCSTNDLDTIVVDKKKSKKYQKSTKTGKKSSSMLSLNVSSLTKLRKLSGSSQEIIKKSVSESHVGQIGNSSDSSVNTSVNVSTADVMHSSIDELKEKEFNDGCDERSDQRLPPIEQQIKPPQNESKAELEESSLLERAMQPEINDDEHASSKP